MKVKVDLNYGDVIIQRVENGWILKTLDLKEVYSNEEVIKDLDFVQTQVFEDPDEIFDEEHVTEAKSLLVCLWNAYQRFFRSKHSAGIEMHVEEKSRYQEEIEREMEEDGEEET